MHILTFASRRIYIYILCIKFRNKNQHPLQQDEFEETKEVIIIRIAKNRQHNGQKKKYKQRSTKQTHKTKDRVTGTQQKTGGELRCSERVARSCSTSDTRSVNLVTNPEISRERGKDREVFTTSETYPVIFDTDIL